MKIEIIHSEASARHVLPRLFNGRLSAERVMHEAAADVEEGLEFWKTIAGTVLPHHHVSREFLNRQG